ncbi:MAG: hypothetical protein EOP52_00245 [Sphingobacteriales bacterium]|nr:MAG: hypothetical protein EOP52_00245 [Sphingobacteriales bacterium]
MKKPVPRRRRISLALALFVPVLLAGIDRQLHLKAKQPVLPVKAAPTTVLKNRVPDTAPALTLGVDPLAARKNVQ